MTDRLLAAHALLTRLPVPLAAPVDGDRLRRAAPLFPAVGVTVGGVAALALLAGSPLGAGFAALCGIAAAIVATGALHEDGLADTADALGARERGRRLDVMRDSRIGTYGALAVVLVLIGRLLLLARLGTGEAMLALVAAHVLGRWSVLPQAALIGPARDDGSGALLAGVSAPAVAAGTTLALALSAPPLLAVAPAALVALPVAAAATGVCALGWRRAFGGLTGDTYGATGQVVELAVYAAVAAAA